MRQPFRLMNKLPRRDLPVRRLALFVFVGALGVVGLRFLAGHQTAAPKRPTPEPDKKALDLTAVFRSLRPRAGDLMAPPRIGFRWVFDPSRLQAAPAQAGSAAAQPAGDTASGTGSLASGDSQPVQTTPAAAEPARLKRRGRTAASTAARASLMPPFLSGDSLRLPNFGSRDPQVRYRVHLLGPGGKTEIVTETDEPRVTLNLTRAFPPGECEWWVEAILPGRAPVASPREKFTLQR